MLRMYVAAANRLAGFAGFAGSDRGEMGPSYIVPTGLLGTVVLAAAYVLRGPLHWLMSLVGR
jgi:hypothetical protein